MNSITRAGLGALVLSYQRYFLNKQDGTYVGGDIGMDVDKLRTLGLNPDDYEEATIKK